MVQAEPLTGRTHQIRVQAAERGFPVLGDTLYGGTPAARVYLHAAEITLQHPATGQEVTFRAPTEFEINPRLALRAGLLDSEATNAFRAIHGASDGWPGWHVERLGDYLLSESEQPLSAGQQEELARLLNTFSSRGACHKLLTQRVRKTSLASASPRLVLGQAAPERFAVRENGLQFELSFNEGYSVGLFLDQRDNRRRLLTGHVAAGFPLFKSHNQDQKPEILNAFAYTCAFSLCAAKAGGRATSLDLSKKYLEWGRRNFRLNRLDPAEHAFIHGDVFDWLRRFARKRCRFDVILLDTPTFSQSKASGVFQAEKDFSRLVAAALPLLKANGVLFASANAADWPPEEFLAAVQAPVRAVGRKVLQQHYAPQPPDFPISRAQPAHLKTVWLRVE